MAAVALIRYTQVSPGVAGQAFAGTIAGGVVSVTNDNNADVQSWRITLLDVPPGSALVPGVLASANGAVPAANFTPDVAGSYRVLLEVFESAGQSGSRSLDIRNFGIPNARGIIIPPYQKNPDPLPLPSSGLLTAKPDECNYNGDERGYAGSAADGQLDQFFRTYDDGAFRSVTTTPYAPTALDAPVLVVNLTTIGGDGVVNLTGSGMRVGQRLRVIAFGGTSANFVTINAPGGHTISGLAAVVVLSGGSAEVEFLGGTVWTLVGAKRMREALALVAGVGTSDLTAGFTTIGSAEINLSDYPNLISVQWRAVIETSSAADAAEIRVYNTTTLAVVGSTLKSSVSLVPELVTEASVTLAPGANIYEAQLRLATTGAPNLATCKQAQLVINWLQP